MKMELDASVMASEIREIYQNQYDGLIKAGDSKVLLSHYGGFSQDLVNGLSSSAEEILISAGDKRIVIKRIFSILIEGLQNIRLHGERDEWNRQLGFIILANEKDVYRIIMANVIKDEDVGKIENYIEKINYYSPEELKEQYLTILSNEFLSHKGGAGLGFIVTRMKSGKPLKYSFYGLKSSQMLFTFEVLLEK